MRYLISGLFVVLVACTGGAGPIDQTGNGSSSSSSGLTSSSGGSSSGGSSGGSSSGGSGGGSNQTVQASEFSQACVESTDCLAIYEGNVCDPCKCPNAAIAKAAASDYAEKFRGAECPTTDVACAADCAEATPVCAQGTCTINR
jgi:hypothetical protein